MTRPRDFDRLARAWLDLMPDEAPDRVIADVLQAVERTSQVRVPIGVTFRRSIRMNRLSYAAVAAAIVAVLVGGTILLTRSSTPNVGGPSQRPSSVPSSRPSSAPSIRPSGAPLPSQLVQTWIGATRDVAGIQTGATTALEIAAQEIVFVQANQNQTAVLRTRASVVGGVLHVDNASKGCDPGAAGDYTWTVSASGRSLSITPTSDTCAARRTALGGTWYVSGCKRTDEFCLGPLDAGTYGSLFLNIHLVGGAWAPTYGRVTFTVPAGWAAPDDWPNRFRLVTAEEFATENQDGAVLDQSAGIELVPRVGVPASGATCDFTVDQSKPRTYAALVASVRSLPALKVGSVTTTTIDGLATTVLNLQLASTWTSKCDPSGTAAFAYLARDGAGLDGEALVLYSGERERLFLIDTGGGDVAAVVIKAPDAASFNGLIGSALPIVQSFSFR